MVTVTGWGVDLKYMGVEPKIGIPGYPKMDGGEHNEKAYFLMDDLGGFSTPLVLETSVGKENETSG